MSENCKSLNRSSLYLNEMSEGWSDVKVFPELSKLQLMLEVDNLEGTI